MTRPLLAVALLAWLVLAAPARADGLLIIANRSVDVAAPMALGEIAAIYLLRLTTWPDGGHIVPVNREATSRTRAEFTAQVLHEDNASLVTYWNEMHFMGKLPPVVQESESAMLLFVQRVPGAIGYISDAASPSGVRVLAHVR